MNNMNYLRFMRKWITVSCGAIFTGGCYGTVAAILVMYSLDVSENDALLYVGLPVAIIGAVYMWPRLPKILGFDHR
jgi:hypothetical protein